MVTALTNPKIQVPIICRTRLVSFRKVCARLHVTIPVYAIARNEMARKVRMYFKSFIKTNFLVLVSHIYGVEKVFLN
jgi:hypothetical protein